MQSPDPKLERIKGKVTSSEDARAKFDRVWAECENYYAGEQDIYRRHDGTQISARTIGNTPGWRNRYVYNQISIRCDREVSAYTAQFPGYDTEPAPPVGANSSTVAGQSAVSAAVAGDRILSHLYDDLEMPRKDSELKQGAVVLGEMYAWPILDTTAGDVLQGTGQDGKPDKRTGKIALKVLDPTQVVWEQGKHFMDSRWHAVKCFYTKVEFHEQWPDKYDSVEKVVADATASPTLSGAILDKGQGTPNLVTVWHYYERPSGKNPKGSHMIFSNEYVLEEGDYPYNFAETNDEPWLVRFFYRLPPRRSRAQGMVEDLLDPQRAYNRRRQLQSEWINFAAVPGMNIPRDSATSTDFELIPGFRYVYTPGVSTGVDFVRPGEMPQGLASSTSDIKNEIDTISGQYDFANMASSAAASTVQQIVQQNEGRRGDVARRFQNAHAQLARRFLLLARESYTESRSFTYRSYAGKSETKINASQELPSFINVVPRTGVPRTPAEVQATATQWASLPFGIPPEKIMLAVENNNLDEITGPFKRDIERQQRRNKEIMELNPRELAPAIAGFAEIMATQMAQAQAQGYMIDPNQISPPPGPWPHADPYDNEAICISVLSDWMKTQEFEMLPRENQQIARWLLKELEIQRDGKQQAEMMQQSMTAQMQGATNASRPGQPAVAPSQASLSSQMPDSVNSNEAQPVAPTAA